MGHEHLQGTHKMGHEHKQGTQEIHKMRLEHLQGTHKMEHENKRGALGDTQDGTRTQHWEIDNMGHGT